MPVPAQSRRPKQELLRPESPRVGDEDIFSGHPNEVIERLIAAASRQISNKDIPLAARVEAIKHLGGDPAESLRLVQNAHTDAADLYSQLRNELELVVNPEGRAKAEPTLESMPSATEPSEATQSAQTLDAYSQPAAKVAAADPSTNPSTNPLADNPAEAEFFARRTSYIPPEHRAPTDRPGAIPAEKPLNRKDLAYINKLEAKADAAGAKNEVESKPSMETDPDQARIVAEVLGSNEMDPTSIEAARQQQLYLARELRDLSLTIPRLHGERAALIAGKKYTEPEALLAAIQNWADAEAEQVVLKDKNGKTIYEPDSNEPVTYPSTHEPVFGPDGEPKYSANHELIVRRKPPIFSEKAIADARQQAKDRIERANSQTFIGQTHDEISETARTAAETIKKTASRVRHEPIYALLQGANYAVTKAPFDAIKLAGKATAWAGKKILSTPYYAIKYVAVAGARSISGAWELRKVKKEARTAGDEVPEYLGSYLGYAVDTVDCLDRIEAMQQRIAELEDWIRAAESGEVSVQRQLDTRMEKLKRELDAGQTEGQSGAEYAAFVADRQERLVEQNALARLLTLATEASMRGNPKPDARAVNRFLLDGRPLESLFLEDTTTGDVHCNGLGNRVQLPREVVEQQRRFASLEVTQSRPLRDAAKRLLRKRGGDDRVNHALAADNFKLSITTAGEITITTWVAQENELTGANSVSVDLNLDAQTSAAIFEAIKNGKLDESGYILDEVLAKLDTSGEAFPELDKTLEQNTGVYAEIANTIVDFQAVVKPLETNFDTTPDADTAVVLQRKHAGLTQALRISGDELSKAGIDDLQNLIDANVQQAERMAKLYGECASQDEIDSAAVAAINEGRNKRNAGFVTLTDSVQTTQQGKAEAAFTKAAAAPERATKENLYRGDNVTLPNQPFTGKSGEGQWRVLQAEHGVYLLELQNIKPGELVLHLTVTDDDLQSWKTHAQQRARGKSARGKMDPGAVGFNSRAQQSDAAPSTTTAPDTAVAATPAPTVTPDTTAATTPEPAATQSEPVQPAATTATTATEPAVPLVTNEPLVPADAQPSSPAGETVPNQTTPEDAPAESSPTLVPDEVFDEPTAETGDASTVADAPPIVDVAKTALDQKPADETVTVRAAAYEAAPTIKIERSDPAPAVRIQPSPEPTTPTTKPESALDPADAPTERIDLAA